MNSTILKRHTQAETPKGTEMGERVPQRNFSVLSNVFIVCKKTLFPELKMNRFSIKGSSNDQLREAWNVLGLHSL